MNQERKRRNASLGKRLVRLHSWNGWLVLLLAVTGIVLSVPALRGALGFVRVGLKEAHIILGLVSTVVVALYVPAMRKHLKQLRGRPRQQWNLAIVLALLAGWVVSGIVLWQFRRLPPPLTNAALWVHDLLTWVGVPYAIFHAVTRSRWLRVKGPAPSGRANEEQPPAAAGTDALGAAGLAADKPLAGAAKLRALAAELAAEAPPRTAAGMPPSAQTGDRPAKPQPAPVGVRFRRTAGRLREAVYTRRTFLTWSFAGLLALLVGPRFVRWLFSGSGMDHLSPEVLAADANSMVPEPTPLPESLVPIGGGGRGEFRVYTIVKMPQFTSEGWTFKVSGLVDKPLEYNWEQFLAIPRVAQVSDFHCVTGWSVYGTTWEGIPLKRLLQEAGVRPAATHVKFYSGDGVYTDSLTMEQANLDDVLVAVLMDGKPIVRDLGGPVRLLVPKMYAYKSVKWLQAIELIDSEHIGYWGRNGYDQHAWVPGMKPKNVSI